MEKYGGNTVIVILLFADIQYCGSYNMWCVLPHGAKSLERAEISPLSSTRNTAKTAYIML